LKGKQMNETRKNEESYGKETLIERLKEQKERNNQHYIQRGYENGKSSAKIMNLSEFKELVKSQSDYLQNPNLTGWESQVVQGSNVWDRWLCDEIQDLEEEDFKFNSDAFLTGWLRGVVEVWDQVKDQI
jgi:hypothetical protein